LKNQAKSFYLLVVIKQDIRCDETYVLDDKLMDLCFWSPCTWSSSHSIALWTSWEWKIKIVSSRNTVEVINSVKHTAVVGW